jgi:gentisate 1,2-dioxygenase
MVTAAVHESWHEDYYKRLSDLHTEPLWYLDMASYSGPPTVPHVWRWKDLMPALKASNGVFTFGQGLEDRRALSLINPARKHGATSTITASLQMINPGEVARVHRHTLTAIRFIISGHGGYTVNDGEKFTMEAGDVILTPSWSWHGHGNDGTEPMFWLDGLESPLLTMMGGDLYEDYPTPMQPIRPTSGNVPVSIARYGGAGLLPATGRPSIQHSPLSIYKWQVAEEALRRLQQVDESPCDGAIVEYVNPLTGGHAVPVMAIYLQLLRRGLHTKAHRHATNTIYLVVRGSGHTIIEGKEYRWGEHDILAVPSWRWHEHVANEETFLFSITDLPVREALALQAEETLEANGGHQLRL